MPTITIVTPSYNQGQYLGETIRSVISQEGDFYIDYIIMDGGSTDESVSVIREYAELLKNGEWKTRCRGVELRWVSEKDKGQAHAINKGFKLAKGEIVAWINSDDMFFEGAFCRVVTHFRSHPEDDFIFGDGDVITRSGELQWEWLSRPFDLPLLKSYHFLWNDFTNFIMQQATFWRPRIFDKIGFLDETFHYGMDMEFWLRVGEAGFKVVHLPVKLGKFRMIPGTKSLSSPTVFWPDFLELFRRYNGAGAMEPFFRYSYYNEGLDSKFDIGVMKQRGGSLFRRWEGLSGEERLILEEKSRKGFNRACLMLSLEAYLKGNSEKADEMFRTAISHELRLIIHYHALHYFLCRLLGKKSSLALRRVSHKIIHIYRMKRYLYRYADKK